MQEKQSIQFLPTQSTLCKTLPTCAVHDLAVHAGTSDLVAGTHALPKHAISAQPRSSTKMNTILGLLGFAAIADADASKQALMFIRVINENV